MKPATQLAHLSLTPCHCIPPFSLEHILSVHHSPQDPTQPLHLSLSTTFLPESSYLSFWSSPAVDHTVLTCATSLQAQRKRIPFYSKLPSPFMLWIPLLPDFIAPQLFTFLFLMVLSAYKHACFSPFICL